jgi:hypothetical protein
MNVVACAPNLEGWRALILEDGGQIGVQVFSHRRQQQRLSMLGAEYEVNIELGKGLRHGETPISPFEGYELETLIPSSPRPSAWVIIWPPGVHKPRRGGPEPQRGDPPEPRPAAWVMSSPPEVHKPRRGGPEPQRGGPAKPRPSAWVDGPRNHVRKPQRAELALLGKREVRHSAFGPLGLICRRHTRRQRLNEGFKGWAMSVFGSATRLCFLLDLPAVCVNRAWSHGSHPRDLRRLPR